MGKNIINPTHISSPEKLLRTICAPDVLPDENADNFEYLRQALFQDLDPKSPYEQLLAEQMVALEWDAVRYRRLRDNLLKNEFRSSARSEMLKGIKVHHAENREAVELVDGQIKDLISADNKRREIGLAALGDKDIDPAVIMAKAYRYLAKDLEVFERQIAETEARRRKLRDDYNRLRGARAKHVEDAEVVEP